MAWPTALSVFSFTNGLTVAAAFRVQIITDVSFHSSTFCACRNCCCICRKHRKLWGTFFWHNHVAGNNRHCLLQRAVGFWRLVGRYTSARGCPAPLSLSRHLSLSLSHSLSLSPTHSLSLTLSLSLSLFLSLSRILLSFIVFTHHRWSSILWVHNESLTCSHAVPPLPCPSYPLGLLNTLFLLSPSLSMPTVCFVCLSLRLSIWYLSLCLSQYVSVCLSLLRQPLCRK